MKNTKNSPGDNSRYEIRIAGSGGQGIILAGEILAEAAILDGKYVVQSQSYGPEARGGNSVSEVIVSDAEIDYPRALALDLLVVLTQAACDRHLPDMKEEGLVIADSDLVRRVNWGRVASLPFSRIASKAGEKRSINMAALGAIAAFYPAVSPGSLTGIMAQRLPSDRLAVNKLAFDEGSKAARDLKKTLRFVATEDEFEI